MHELCRRSIVAELLRSLQRLSASCELNLLAAIRQLVHARLLDDGAFLSCSHPCLKRNCLRGVIQKLVVVDGKIRRTGEHVRLARNARTFRWLSTYLGARHSLAALERHASVDVARRCAETNVSKFLIALNQFARTHHLSAYAIIVYDARYSINVVIVVVVLSLVALGNGDLLIVCIGSAMLLAVDDEALKVALAAPRQFNAVRVVALAGCKRNKIAYACGHD